MIVKSKYCVIFNEPKAVSEIGLWESLAGFYDIILGYSLFGDLFLMDSDTTQVSLLYVMPPELNEMQFFGK